MDLAYFGAILAAIVLTGVVVVFAVRHFFYQVFAPTADYTFIERPSKDSFEVLQKKKLVRKNSNKIVTFSGRDGLTYPVYNEATNQLVEKSFVQSDGKISLRYQTCKLAPFSTPSQEGIMMSVTPTVTFRVVASEATQLASIDDFGSMLSSNIMNAFQSEIGKRPDEDVRAEQSEISLAVLHKLADAEANVPMGIEITAVQFQATKESAVARQPFVPALAPPTVGEDGTPTTGDAVAAPTHTLQALPTSGMKRPLDYTQQDLDSLMDELKKRDAAEVAALIQLMEMQTRQNIVEMVSKSDGALYMSTDGLAVAPDVATLKELLAQRDRKRSPQSSD